MRNTLVFAFLLVITMFACKNAEIIHKDFDYTTGYFPYQYPVRTLVLGDDIYDNTNDNAHKFLISAAMGGVYENKMDRNFSFRIEETLCQNAEFGTTGQQILPLPANYYTLSSPNSITIPSGQMNGAVEVQLSEAFFNDPKSISLGYVVPIVLTGSTDVDSILVGNTNLLQPDKRKLTDWNILPKDFTMFAIKYINEYHGNYFHSGSASVTDSTGVKIDEREYKKPYVENNEVRLLTTTARRQVEFSTHLQSEEMSGPVRLLLTFDGDQCSVSSSDTTYTVSGTGQFKKGTFNWGNKARNGITLEYTVSDGKNTYSAKDELVARDRAVTMEVYSPKINQ